MKYNVKQAVSGIQGQMDKANQNRILAQALGGLAEGFKSGADIKNANEQYEAISGSIDEQIKSFEDLKNSPDKFERLIANDSLLKLRVFKSGLRPSSMADYGKNYRNIMGGGSLFEPLASIERAKIIAAGMAQREDARRQYTFDLRDAAAGKGKDPFRLFGQPSVSAPFVNLMKQGGNLFDNFMQGSSGMAPDINPYIEGSLNDLGL